jgi:hypothetical protein
VDLTPEDRAKLSHALGVRPDGLDAALAALGRAALEEYVQMALGHLTFNRLSDLYAYRLLLLVRHLFGHRLPTEEQVGRLFNTSSSQLIVRAMRNTYRYELEEPVLATIRDTLARAHANPDRGVWEVTADPDTVKLINAELAGIDGTLDQVSKRRHTVGQYDIPTASYHALREFLSQESGT